METWYQLLSFERRQEITTTHITFMEAIREEFLGDDWVQKMMEVFDTQRFRQKGQGNEDPASYIARRILYTRMLTTADLKTREGVLVLLCNCPISWKPILNVETIHSSRTLTRRTIMHGDALVQAWKSNCGSSNQGLSQTDVMEMIRLAVSGRGPRNTQLAKFDFPSSAEPEEHCDNVLVTVFNVAARKQHPRPTFFWFKQNDKPTTWKRQPPLPCKVCDGPHCNPECPHYNEYKRKLEEEKKKTHSTRLRKILLHLFHLLLQRVPFLLRKRNPKTLCLLTLSSHLLPFQNLYEFRNPVFSTEAIQLMI